MVSQHGSEPAIIARSATPVTTSGSYIAPAEITLTYHDLDILSNRQASVLQSMGISKGARVAVSLGNTIEFASLTYALFKIGAILVPLNPSFNATQVESALNHLGAEMLIMGAVCDVAYRPGRGRCNIDVLERVVGDLNAASSPDIKSTSVPSLRKVIVVDNRSSHPEVSFPLESYPSLIPYSSLLNGSDSPPVLLQPLSPDDPINIQFTSGTTSSPKAAMLSHTNILNNGAFIAHRMGLEPNDRIVVPPPLFHCFGCILGYMATATTGAAILFPSPAFDPNATLRMCVDHDGTGLYGVATMILSILEALDKGTVVASPPKNLRKGIVAGSSVPESLMRRLWDRIGLQDLVICYGMTETSPVSCMTAPADPLEKRAGTVGRAMPHTEVKIVSATNRNEILPLNTKGELACAGYLVMSGYYDDVARTAEVRIADEAGKVWMYSGDEAEMDEDGYVTITGRIKDLIIRGGENIHPLEVENCLFQMDGVKEVSVVGVPDEKYGEVVAAFVVTKDGWETGSDDTIVAQETRSQGSSAGAGSITREAVREWVKTNLSSHLVPRYVFWVEDYPKTASGKIQKFKLKDIAVERLGLAKEK